MDRLAGFLERRRWIVLAAWLLLLLAVIPFAAKQLPGPVPAAPLGAAAA
jgi:uncharacterized membrane protein YdfJ with MMPL/SSD domain